LRLDDLHVVRHEVERQAPDLAASLHQDEGARPLIALDHLRAAAREIHGPVGGDR
jgi:hypothetical protein